MTSVETLLRQEIDELTRQIVEYRSRLTVAEREAEAARAAARATIPACSFCGGTGLEPSRFTCEACGGHTTEDAARHNFHIGDLVRFHPFIGRAHDGNVYRIRDLGALGSGEQAAWLDGKRGCVSLRALSLVECRAEAEQ